MKKEMTQTLKFPVYMNDVFMQTNLDELELSQRAYHCLKRRGYNTVGDVVSDISCESDLRMIRNMGEKSAREVMQSLYNYQLKILPPERRKSFLARVKQLNKA